MRLYSAVFITGFVRHKTQPKAKLINVWKYEIQIMMIAIMITAGGEEEESEKVRNKEGNAGKVIDDLQ